MFGTVMSGTTLFWSPYTERYRSGHNGADSKSVCEQSHMGSNPILSANGALENPVFSRVFSIRWKFFRFYFLCFCQFSEPILCSFSPVNIRIKNLQTPREIRLFNACILFAALERFPSDKKSPNFKTPGCGQPHQKSCVDFSGRGSNRQKEKCTVRPLCFLP